MDGQTRVVEGFWLRRNKRSPPSRPPANMQVTLDGSTGALESGNVRLASLGANLVTFSLVNTGLTEGVPAPKPLEEPTPPSTARIALGTLLVIAVVSAVTFTLGWLDWPFVPGDLFGRHSLSRNGSADARRHGESVVRAAMADNHTAGDGLDSVSAVKAKRMAGPTIVPGMRTFGDELDDASFPLAENNSDAMVTVDETFIDGDFDVTGTGA
ncbi:hypothetical protein HPB50_004163 [Hyalomma asiaticum]|uniref:Uncharacterized protein n=1 Tax=Hyalomma asiaticum TaxID=266040 RepID=A0ACB7SS69_HYAAI|nr:hypothetical protein HPB50_004163 [Hyalomma asiaticum]